VHFLCGANCEIPYHVHHICSRYHPTLEGAEPGRGTRPLSSNYRALMPQAARPHETRVQLKNPGSLHLKTAPPSGHHDQVGLPNHQAPSVGATFDDIFKARSVEIIRTLWRPEGERLCRATDPNGAEECLDRVPSLSARHLEQLLSTLWVPNTSTEPPSACMPGTASPVFSRAGTQSTRRINATVRK
jgi:hypothetical protein